MGNKAIGYNSPGTSSGTGGGAGGSKLKNCLVTGNYAIDNGGGTYVCSLWNCAVVNNSCIQYGGGSYGGSAVNSTFTGNSAGGYLSPGGAVANANLTNCIAYGNKPIPSTTLSNYYNCTFSYSCTAPLPTGSSNIAVDPQVLSDGYHLSSNSPCRGAGTFAAVTGNDLDGQPWLNPPSIGCDEWQPAPILLSQPFAQVGGSPLSLTIGGEVLAGGPFTFFWYKDGVLLTDGSHYGGTQTGTLVVSPFGPAGAGTSYQLIVSNSFGMVTSAVVRISAIHCVAATGTNPVPPYSDWSTAATNIQDAIDAATAGDSVLVTNGIYGTGGRVMAGTLTNRIAITKPLTVSSVYGPAVTIIAGQLSGLRCAWLTNGAALSGFTLRFGGTLSGGTTTNLHRGGGAWCAGTDASLVNCYFVNCQAYFEGGGAYGGTLKNCWLWNNFCTGFGLASDGSRAGGAGAAKSLLNNCSVTYNESRQASGATLGCWLTNCTIAYNDTSSGFTAGSHSDTAVNCIIYFNSYLYAGPANYYSDFLPKFQYCCTTPQPGGAGNITNNPQLVANDIHLGASSPCRGAGQPGSASGTDIDGQPWANAPSMGCDEWHADPVVEVPASYVDMGSRVGEAGLRAAVLGQAPIAYWWSKDGTLVDDNGRYSASHTAGLLVRDFRLEDGGMYQIIASNAFGMTTSAVAQVSVHCANSASTAPQSPYTTWATAASTIQDAADAAAPNDVVLVTNGIYASGGRPVSAGDPQTNRVNVPNEVVVMSVNGPGVTVIEGQWDPATTNGPGSVRGVWNGWALSGFTIRNCSTVPNNPYGQDGGGMYNFRRAGFCIFSNNATSGQGGGVFNGNLTNCLLLNNWAVGSGGGFASPAQATSDYALNNCAVLGNHAGGPGGGCYSCTLRNCTVTYNSSPAPAGVYTTALTNCVVYFNSDPTTGDNGANYGSSVMSYTCSTPLPPGPGNLAGDPQLGDAYHLMSLSPCRGAGLAGVDFGTDLDGELWANPPSIGCDEVYDSDFIGPLSVSLSPPWSAVAVGHIMPLAAQISGRASSIAWSFGDGQTSTNASFISLHAWTNTGDYTVSFTAYNADNPGGVSTSAVVHVIPFVVPSITTAAVTGTNFALSFPGQPGVNYVIEQTTNLAPPAVWQTVLSLFATNTGTFQVKDPTTTNPARFYRVRMP
jgi:hypothetical protein